MIEGGKSAVYEQIVRRKAGKTIWTKERRAVLLHGPAFTTTSRYFASLALCHLLRRC
jgi:hypothetical protein